MIFDLIFIGMAKFFAVIVLIILLGAGAYFVWIKYLQTPAEITKTDEKEFISRLVKQTSTKIIAAPPYFSETLPPPSALEREILSSAEIQRLIGPISQTAPTSASAVDLDKIIAGLKTPSASPPKPDLEAPSATLPFFEKIAQAADAIELKAARELAVPGTSTVIGISTKEIEVPMTPEEFHFLYPENFLKNLSESQSIIQIVDPGFQPLAKIEIDAEVRMIEEKTVAALLAADLITKEKAEEFIKTIRFTLPKLQLTELATRRELSRQQSRPFSERFLRKSFLILTRFPEFLSALFNQEIAPKKLTAGPFFTGPLEKTQQLKNKIAPSAKAAVIPCGFCFSVFPCFRPGVPEPPELTLSILAVKGSNTFRPLCYCTGCLSPFGCLNTCFGNGTIHHPAGICGCGAPF